LAPVWSQNEGKIVEHSVLNKVNFNHLKIFSTVYRLKSMTLAAQELFLTQSGVSQHVKKLEDDLGAKLFVRDRSELYATPDADQLHKACERAFGDISLAIEKMHKTQNKQLEGTLKIGVPTEFGNNVIIPRLAQWSHLHPEVKFDIIYGYGTHLTELLESGGLDLAFVDSIQKHRHLETEIVAEETLSLVVTTQYIKNKNLNFKTSKLKVSQFEALDYLEYEHKESILRMWFQHHYGKKNLQLNVRVWAMDVQGVAGFIKQNMGAAVLPDHVTEKLLKEGISLHIFKGTHDSLKNKISLVSMRKRPLPRAGLELREFLLKEKF